MTGGIVGLYELKDGGWRLAVNCQLNKLLQLLLATDDDDDQQQKKKHSLAKKTLNMVQSLSTRRELEKNAYSFGSTRF